MKNEVLYMVIQPETEKAFWISNIKLGVFDFAKELQCVPCILNPEKLPRLTGVPVLVVGNNDDWLEGTLRQLTTLGARSIVVNGSMQDSEIHSHSGVVFELGNAIKYSLRQLQAAGRKRTALLGANPHSVSDLCKCKAFDDPEHIIWAHGELEICVLDFIQHFKEMGYDSVICANDTVAICLIRNMREQGFNLPEALYIIGMGNSYIGATLSLPLTSIDFDYYRMGKTAVKLYSFLRENADCGTVISHLPCRLMVRASAPVPEYGDAVSLTEASPVRQLRYFSGKDAQNIVKVESVLQAGDAVDREIVLGLLEKKSAEKIAETLFLSTRAVRYRITNLIKKHGFADRTELVNALNAAIYKEETTEHD